MIDLKTEKLVPIREVPQRLPRRPNGNTVHISAVYRWVQRGIRGARLEVIQIGGSTYTSVEALQRFAEALSQDRHDQALSPPATSATRQKQIERAAREVEAILNGPRTTRDEKPKDH